jgi:hypothetical protein
MRDALRWLADDCARPQIALYPAYLYRLRVHNKRAYYASEARTPPLRLPCSLALHSSDA